MEDILTVLFHSYKTTHIKLTGHFLNGNHTLDTLQVGDIITLYGDSIVYGLLVNANKEAGIYEFIDLVPTPILGDFSYEIPVDFVFTRTLYVTPLTFSVHIDSGITCDKVHSLTQDRLQNVLQAYDTLRFREFYGIRKQFLDYESERLEALYFMYFSHVTKYID